jgi:hypothetical protein
VIKFYEYPILWIATFIAFSIRLLYALGNKLPGCLFLQSHEHHILNQDARFIFALVDGALVTQGYRVTAVGTLHIGGGVSSRETHDGDRKKRQNQRRELKRLNRLIKALRGIYREVARSSLEQTCVELGKERDAARKECETLRLELSKCLFGDGSEGVVGSSSMGDSEKYWNRNRGPYDVRVTSMTGSVTGSGGGGGGGDGGGDGLRITFGEIVKGGKGSGPGGDGGGGNK